MKEEKIFRRKFIFDTLTDTVTIDFGCGCSSSQSKKTVLLRHMNLLFLIFVLYITAGLKKFGAHSYCEPYVHQTSFWGERYIVHQDKNILELKLFEFKSIIIWSIIQGISLFNLPHVLESEQVNKFGPLKLLSI